MISFFINYKYCFYSLLAGIFTFLVTSLGSMLVFIFKKENKKILDISLSIACGLMISSSFFSLLLPALNITSNLLIIISGFLLGALFLYIINKIFENKKIYKNNKSKRICMFILSITLHNIPEGLSIGVSFGSNSMIINSILLTIAIAIQNFPEGAFVSIPLKREGLSSKKAFIIGSLTAIVEPVFALLGSLVSIKLNNLLPFFLSFASGSMMYSVCSELLLECLTNKNKELVSLFIIIGFTLMMFLDLLF